MQRKKFFVAGAGSAAALALAAGTNVAPALAAPTQMESDADVWRVRGRLIGMIGQLNGLESDYNGNRASAIAALGQAKDDLDAAVKVRGMNGPLSDTIVRYGIEEAQEMITRLSADQGDYNGKKQEAIGKLNAAKLALQAAVRQA